MKALMPFQKLVATAIVVACSVLISGCSTRSISDSGYHSGNAWHGHYHGSPSYKGELSELDVLGYDRKTKVTEEQIAQALDSAHQVKLSKGANVMVIQSGAYLPDEPVLKGLGQYFNVVPFTGQPDRFMQPLYLKVNLPRELEPEPESYAKTLRLAAAQAGCQSIICYWGTLESAVRRHGTKTVSWVPVVGGLVLDETQYMRIRLKVAVVDVRSGNWAVFTPEVYENKALSGKIVREASDQSQVEKLKKLAYATAVEDLVKIYAN